MADKDYHAVVADLIAQAVGSARIAGENARVTRLVAGSIGRFAGELQQGQQPDQAFELIDHAVALLSQHEGATVVPALTAAVEALARRR